MTSGVYRIPDCVQAYKKQYDIFVLEIFGMPRPCLNPGLPDDRLQVCSIPMTDFQFKQFGKYQLLDKIAVGGMAELFRAKLTGVKGFEKLIAIKKILSNLSDEENLVKSFIDEAKLAALLHHENIIQIYDFGSINGEYFIAMEYLFGKDLRTITRMAKKRDLPLSLENILYITSRICAGLDYSHNLKDLQGQPLNIIHRDINPQNILITYDGHVKIIDFGIAKAASHNTKTRENLIKGKLAYMSPEQANGLKIDHRSDIFSTGIILYELLAARRMFEGETLHVLSLVREARYDPPQEVIDRLPAKLNQILCRALAKEPEKRYQSGSEMLADLEECAYELSLRPNSRSFAGYMKKLFKEELAQEEAALWTNTQINAGNTGIEEDSAEGERTSENTVVLTRIHPGRILERLSSAFSAAKRLKRFIPEKKFLTDRLARLAKRITIPKPKHFNYIHLAAILGFVVIAVVFGTVLKRLPLAGSQNEIEAHTVKSVEADESVELAKLEAAKAAFQAQRHVLAEVLLEEILNARPEMRTGVRELYTKVLEANAAGLVEKHPDQAEGLLLKALALKPDSISLLSRLGYVYVERKNFQKAIDAYEKVAELAPRLPDAFFNLGYVYAITENYQKARDMYGKVVELSPPFIDEALFNLAVIQQKLGDREQSIQNLERAVRLNPENVSAKNYLHQLKKQTGNQG
jgi:serine/threonine protein kinase